MDVFLKYVGGGYFPGIPARDLTYDEARQYGVSKLTGSGLYERASSPQKPKPSSDKSLTGASENKKEGGQS